MKNKNTHYYKFWCDIKGFTSLPRKLKKKVRNFYRIFHEDHLRHVARFKQYNHQKLNFRNDPLRQIDIKRFKDIMDKGKDAPLWWGM